MKITDHIKNAKGKTLFSFELLPPVKGQSIQWIYDAIEPLLEFNPPFIDVTSLREDYIYKEQANGLLQKVSYRKRPGTIAICAAIIHKYKVDAVPHLICGGFTKEETENALIDLQFLGIDNVLALRGDARKADGNFVPTPGGHCYATDLIEHIKNHNEGKFST
jgi:methylenetetrahydrofolate reductase (NADPH)